MPTLSVIRVGRGQHVAFEARRIPAVSPATPALMMYRRGPAGIDQGLTHQQRVGVAIRDGVADEDQTGGMLRFVGPCWNRKGKKR